MTGGMSINILQYMNEGNTLAIITSVQGMDKRAIEEPSTETSIRGSRDWFVESLLPVLFLLCYNQAMTTKSPFHRGSL